MSIEILNFSTAQIVAQGAHLTRFQDWFYLSPSAIFEAGTAIRGGIPLVFPWFGPNLRFPEAPAHGFARTAPWKLENQNEKGAIWCLSQDDATSQFWPFAYQAQIEFSFGETLDLRFRIQNCDRRSFNFEFAFHAYFAVSDVRHVKLQGLDGCEFLDQIDNLARHTQNNDVIFEGETDRIYLDTNGPLEIVDGASGFVLRNLGGWRSTVVWNPWAEKAARLKDLGADQWPHFVCVECGAVAENAPHLHSGQSYEIGVSIARRGNF